MLSRQLVTMVQQYDIPVLVSHELRIPSSRPKVDLYDDFIYLVLHFPVSNFFGNNHEHRREIFEVDFILGKDFLITTHYQPVQQLNEFAEVFESNSSLSKKRNNDIHAGFLFYYMLEQIYQSLEPGLEYLNDNLKRIEDKIFSGHESETVSILAKLNRDFLDFKWALKAHRGILTSLDLAGRDFFGDKFGYYTHAIIGQYEKVWSMLENQRETFNELRSTNESLLSIKTNQTMKVLTVLTFVFLPLTLIGTIFGMSGDANMPIIKAPGGFFIVLIIMAIVVTITAIFVKYKKWL
ncbi:MAG: Mg2 transporter protein CorA family protein [Parcubacteria group bacterium GW2011_GWA1_43_21]|nr:MAG: Mg2 transporter protein CorA family protein [Parcubacteria group bacterium GW2011_GWA1_43_21]